METAVRLTGVGKSFGEIKVLDNIDLTVETGSFTSLLGPSGCGKTTLLNIIGGLDRPGEGEIRLGGELVYSAHERINTPIERRNVGYVFQAYALWPHMTVLENVGYPLRLRNIDRRERDRRSREMLEKLELSALSDRYPFQLSGGQQQRVAIARSIVYRPRLLLLDEPLSNLDAQLRERARAWLKTIHASFNLTTILVTHDQSEALSLSDQVVLLNRGRVEQVGTAADIYERPRTAYAAEFVGGANIIQGHIGNRIDGGLVTEGGIHITARAQQTLATGTAACVVIHPQKIQFASAATSTDPSGTLIPFQTATVLYQGANFEVTGTTPFGDIRILAARAPTADDTQILLPTEQCLCVGL